MNLPATGWDQYSKSSEPYAQGRFRGINFMFLAAEYRKHIWGSDKNPKLLGAVAFANFTTASGDKNGIDLFEYLEPGYGLGVRFNISKKARTNIGRLRLGPLWYNRFVSEIKRKFLESRKN